MVATSTVLISSPPAAPTAGNNSPVCEGAALLLTSDTITNATYSWIGPNFFSSSSQNPVITGVTIAAAGTYSVIAIVGGCNSAFAVTTVTIKNTPIAPVTGSNSPICVDSIIQLTASTVAGASYSWMGPNGFTSSSQNPSLSKATLSAMGNYSVTVNIAGCESSAIDSIIVLDCPYPTLEVPTGFSPDGDGVNDLFEIKNIFLYPDNNLTIFNRWGNIVYEKQGYDNTWSGILKTNGGINLGSGKVQPGTYFYVLEFTDPQNIPYNYKGYLVIKY